MANLTLLWWKGTYPVHEFPFLQPKLVKKTERNSYEAKTPAEQSVLPFLVERSNETNSQYSSLTTSVEIYLRF